MHRKLNNYHSSVWPFLAKAGRPRQHSSLPGPNSVVVATGRNRPEADLGGGAFPYLSQARHGFLDQFESIRQHLR
jgi:hypothetical protein